MGEGAGLIKDNGICAGHSLQELASLDRDVLPPRLTHGREHRQGHGQFQGTGEVHHEHRQGPGQVPGECKAHQAAGKGIGHQLVCQVGRFGFGGGLHLFGTLDHLNDLVIAALAGGLLYLQHGLALLHHSAGINRAAGPLGHGDGFAGEGCLVDGDLSLRHHAVQGDDASGSNHDPVAGSDLADRGEHFTSLGFQPHPIHMERQALCQVGYGLFPCPILQQFTDLQQEHDSAGSTEVPAADGDPDGQRIQHLHLDLTMSQTAQTSVQKGDHVPNNPGDPQRGGQKQGSGCFHRHLAYQLLLELSVQSPSAVAGQSDRRLRPGPGERAEGGEDSFPVSRIGHDDAAGALMDHGLPGPGLSLQPGFQQIRLADRHVFLPEPQTHPAPALVYDGCSHASLLS